MNSTFRYGPAKDPDVPAMARLLHCAFGSPLDKAEEWLRLGGLEHARLVRTDDGGIPGCLLRIPMGEYFGGRSVPVIGIAGVAVAPEARGRGVARELMGACVREIAGEGSPLSGLFCSTQELYRQVGYEQAGHRFLTRLRFSDMSVDARDAHAGERDLAAAPLGAGDEPEVRACYADFARRYDGMLDRGEYVWRRTRQMREIVYEGFGFRAPGGALEGYVFLTQVRNPSGRHDVQVSDFAFVTPRAGRRIAALLANYATMMEECVLPGGPLHPLAHFLAQQRFAVEKKDYWMLRITDVARAVAARGWAAQSAEVVLDVRDDLVPANAGAWRIRVRDGAGEATRVEGAGRAGCLSIGIRGLAAMFSGLVSPRQSVVLGWAGGDDAAIERAQRVFPAGTPWMTDHY